MARTPEDIIREMLGRQQIQIALLTSTLDTAEERIAALEAERAKPKAREEAARAAGAE